MVLRSNQNSPKNLKKKRSEFGKSPSIFLLVLAALMTHNLTNQTIIKISNNDDFSSGNPTSSTMGGSRLFIRGSGFDATDFNNNIFVGVHVCTIDNYYTTETLLVCELPRSYYTAETYEIKVFVKGVEQTCGSNVCQLTVSFSKTPNFHSVYPQSTFPGETLNIYGVHRADNYSQIQFLKINGRNCILSDEQVENTSISFSNFKTIDCQLPEDLEPGDHQLTMVAKIGTGFASATTSATGYKVGSETEKYNVRIHPKITGVSPNEGFLKGQEVEISGVGFGQDLTGVSVEVGGLPCVVSAVQDDKIVCAYEDATVDAARKVWKGNSGLISQKFNENISFADLYSKYGDSAINLIHESNGNVQVSTVLSMENTLNGNNIVNRMYGIFKPSVTGTYKFYTAADNESLLKISQTPIDVNADFDESTLQTLCEYYSAPGFRNFYVDMENQICEAALTGGQDYYFVFLHREYSGDDHYSVAVEVPNTDATKPNQVSRIHEVRIDNTPVREVMEVVINNATGGTYRVFFPQMSQVTDPDGTVRNVTEYNKKSDDIPFDASADSFKNLVKGPTGYWMLSVERIEINASGTQETDPSLITGRKYTLTFQYHRGLTMAPILDTTNLIGSGMVTTAEVTQAASPVLGGSFKLKYGTHITSSIWYGEWSGTVSLKLEELEPLSGGVTVFESGYWQDGKTWKIVMDSVNGQGEVIEVVENNLTGGVSGSPQVVVDNNIRASGTNLFHLPVPSEFLQTFHFQPQVVVKKGNIGAGCPSQNCGFTFIDNADTPTIESFDVSSNPIAITLASDYASKNGQELLSDAANMKISFGHSECTSPIISLPTINCTLATDTLNAIGYEAGSNVPIIKLQGKGTLSVTASPEVSTPTVTSVSPNQGSEGGGLVITISGSRFGADASRIEVTIGDNECRVLTTSWNEITCTTPAKNASGDNLLKVVVNAQEWVEDVGSRVFEYSLARTPTITSLDKPTASPILKQDLMLTGTNFGTDRNQLKVMLVPADPSSGLTEQECFVNNTPVTDTGMICKLSGGKSGSYKLQMFRDGYGYAVGDPATAVDFKYEIQLSSISQSSGSVEGGHLLTLTGDNFSTVLTDNQVIFGESANLSNVCAVQTATKTTITCLTPKISPPLETPQPVRVIGKLTEESVCTGSCDYEFSVSSTPVVASISASSGVFNDVITVTGTNLDPIVADDRTIKIGDANVSTVSTGSATSFTFNVPAFSEATGEISITIGGKGSVQFDPSVTTLFTNDFSVSSVSPATGSKGGNKFTIDGNAFHSEKGSVRVTIGGEACHIETASPTQLTCWLYNTNFPDNSVQTVNVLNITKDDENNETSVSQTCGSCQYTVDASSPEITALSNLSLSDSANATFTVDGSDLRGNLGSTSVVLIASDRSKFDTLRNTGSVSAGSGVNDADLTFANSLGGEFDILYFIDTVGFATTSPSARNVTLAASNLTQSNSAFSLNGGGTYQVTGKGFYPDDFKDLYKIEICGRPCKMASSARTLLECKTPKFNTVSIQTDLNIDQESVIPPEDIISSNASGTPLINDDSPATGFVASSASCHVGYDFGEGLLVQTSKIRLFPTLDTDEKMLIGAVIEGSMTGGSDDSEWTEMVVIDYNIVENWNSFFPDAAKNETWNFRFIRVRNTQYCAIGEFEVWGILLNNAPTANKTSHTCDVQVYLEDTLLATLTSGAEYREDQTPIVTSISPKYISTAGGEEVTITGTNLDVNGSVYIDNVPCAILAGSSTSTTLKCNSGSRAQLTVPSFEVFTSSSGLAIDRTPNGVLYADRWSDTATWGGESLPREGDLVVVPEGMTLLVDVSTPVMSSVIVRGALIFADEADMTFDTFFLMVVGGKLQIGLPEDRYTHKLLITLHGDRYSKMFPGFGNKNIMVQGGSIDIHGAKRDVTWTMLDTTAQAGDSSFTLMKEVDWQVGEELVISPTGRSRDEVEERTISAVSTSGGKTTITLDQPLSHSHYAGTLEFNGVSTDIRGEVGLLTRNVVVQGDANSVRDMYGSHIMLRGKEGQVVGRFSYFETRHAGQAFQMGRYPIHFHMIGNVIGSYVEGCSVHHTFNRATTIHGVHYLHIKNNVYYRHMGHAIFVEDSIESNNVVEDNLVIHISPSTALLASDLKPAGAWITRPKNFFRRNHIVGSTHFSFWYDLPNNPTGPSATSSICPVGEPLGQFDHNVGHSSGIGLRVYPQYFPRTNPCGAIRDDSLDDPFRVNEPVPAIFKHNVMYNNGNGIFHRNIGAIQHIDLRLFGNGTAIVISEPDRARDTEPRIESALIVGSSELSDLHGGGDGVLMNTARKDGFLLSNADIHNFNGSTLFTTCNGCGDEDHRDFGGRRTSFKNLSFTNVSAKRISYRDPDQDKDIFYDMDGTLIHHMTGLASTGGWITPFENHLDVPECTRVTDTTVCSHECVICNDSISILRMVLLGHNNRSLLRGQHIKLFNYEANAAKTPPVEFDKALTDESAFGSYPFRYVTRTMGFEGWTFNVATGYNYNLHFGTGIDWLELELRNNRYWQPWHQSILRFNNTEQRELMEMRTVETMTLEEKRSNDPVIGDSSYLIRTPENKLDTVLTSDSFGTFNYNNITQSAEIKIDGTAYGNVFPTGVYCRDNCPEPEEGAPIEDRIRLWSNPDDWDDQGAPLADTEVEIKPGWNMYVDTVTPIMAKITINGRLSFSNMFDDVEVRTKVLDIGQFGQFYAGKDDDPFVKKAKVTLTGVFADPTHQVGLGIAPSAKSVIVRGKMRMYGKPPSVTWTNLYESVSPGQTKLRVNIPTGKTLDWAVGGRIVIGSSSTHHDQHEIGQIQAIDTTTGEITLTDQIKHFHYGSTSTVDVTEVSKTLDMRAEVGYVDRNIVINGSDEDEWGCSVLVPQYDYIGGDTPVNIQGELTLDGVMFERCGQRDAGKGAVDLRELNPSTTVQSITNSSIINSLGWSLGAYNSGGLTFNDNIVYNSKKFGIYMESVSKATLERNLVIGVRERENYSNTEYFDLIIGMYVNDTSTLEARDTVIRHNRVSSAPWFSYVVPGYECTHSGDPNFFDNVAHSSKAGWLPFAFDGGLGCQKFSDFIAYKNMEQGFVNRIDGSDIRVSKMVLADNNNSIAVNGGNSGGWYQEVEVADSVIYGRALEDCPDCYSDQSNCNHNGMYSSIFNEEAYDFFFAEERLPLHNSTSSAYNQASLNRVKQVHFKNFKESYDCPSKHIAFRLNNFYQDGVPAVYIEDVSLDNVDHNSKFFFANHTRHANPVVFCGKRDCTGIYNTPIFDLTGSFFGKPMHFFGWNLGAGRDGDCDFYEIWNGHACNPEYGQLQMLKPDMDRGAIISPLTISRNDYSEDFVEEMKFEHSVDSESKFAALVKLRQEHKVAFSQTMPSGIRYKLVAPQETDYTIIRVYSEKTSTMYLTQNGNKLRTEKLLPGELPDFANKPRECGTNYYLVDSRELIFILTGAKDCDLVVEHANSISISARLDIDPADFFSENLASSFEDRVAAMLGISADRIRVVSIQKGSTIVQFIIERNVSVEAENENQDQIDAELTEFYNKFERLADSGTLDLGAPILKTDPIYNFETGGTSPTTQACELTNTCPPTSNDKENPETIEGAEDKGSMMEIALAVAIPLSLLFILMIVYSVYVHWKKKKNSKSFISIGTNAQISSNPENGNIEIKEMEEEKKVEKKKKPMSKAWARNSILKIVSEQEEEYGVESGPSSKQQFYLFGKAE